VRRAMQTWGGAPAYTNKSPGSEQWQPRGVPERPRGGNSSVNGEGIGVQSFTQAPVGILFFGKGRKSEQLVTTEAKKGGSIKRHWIEERTSKKTPFPLSQGTTKSAARRSKKNTKGKKEERRRRIFPFQQEKKSLGEQDASSAKLPLNLPGGDDIL